MRNKTKKVQKEKETKKTPNPTRNSEKEKNEMK